MDAMAILFSVMNSAGRIHQNIRACFGASALAGLMADLAEQVNDVGRLMVLAERLDEWGANIVERDGRPTMVRYRVAR